MKVTLRHTNDNGDLIRVSEMVCRHEHGRLWMEVSTRPGIQLIPMGEMVELRDWLNDMLIKMGREERRTTDGKKTTDTETANGL